MSTENLVTPATKLRRELGNVAVIREALKILRDDAREFHHQILNSTHSEIVDKYTCEKKGFGASNKLRRSITLANRALNESLRNCDVGSDWLRDFYCHFKPPKGVREMPPEWVDALVAFCKWLVAKAPTEEGGETC